MHTSQVKRIVISYLKRKSKQFVRDEEGAIFIWFLIFAIIFVYIWTFNFDTRNMISISKNIENNIEIAALASAEATPDSLASNNPQIDPLQAEATFKDILAENLRLNPGTLAPLLNSRIRYTPLYSVYTYNGPFPFTYTDPISGKIATLSEPSVVVGISVRYDHIVRNKSNNIVRFIVAKVHRM